MSSHISTEDALARGTTIRLSSVKKQSNGMQSQSERGVLRDRAAVRVHHFFRTPLVALAAIEALALLLSPVLARTVLGAWGAADGWLLPEVMFAALQLVALLSMGLYSRRQRARLAGILLRVLAAVVVGSAAFVLLSFLVPPVAMPRGVLLLAVIVAFVLLALIRYAFESLVDEEIFKRRVLAYGAGRRAVALSQLRRRHDRRGFAVLGYVLTPGDRLAVPPQSVLEIEGTLLRFCRENAVDEIVVAMDDRRRAFPVHELLECRLAGITITELVDFLEAETGKVRLDVLNPSWIIFAPGFSRSPVRQFTERAMDVIASLGILFFAWPAMLLTALAIKLEEGFRAPVIYSQVRVGFEGRHFRVLKFRSMRVDAEKGGKAIWAVRGDPRVTRVGAFIRKTRLDELPQLFNVLRGDMSFVGPRPERPEFVSELEQRIPYYRERHAVKPGITGWAQLCYPYGASEQDAAEKLQYDLYYVKNQSLLFDIMILLQTAEVVLWGKGAR
jgi:sugar transferase (PEP-CTERM system associated)